MNTLENNKRDSGRKFKNSISLKLLVIVSLSLIMLIPTVFIRNLIDERQDRRDETIREITSKWGEKQQVFGPVIIIPYEKLMLGTNNTYLRYRHYFHILPDELNISGELEPEVRYRGIYEVITYCSDMIITGEFRPESFNDLPDTYERILWSEAKLVTGISDLTGLDAITDFTWDQTALTPEGGIPYETPIRNGIHASVKINKEMVNRFQIKLSLNGSESISFIPAGKTTTVKLNSGWADPSFNGSALPDIRKISPDGFTAEWQSLHLTRSFPQKWSDRDYDTEIPESAFGVDLLIPVDIYQKSMRSVKYALLIIGLTFLVIFFIEMISKQRIHVVQYLLTGAALIIFYSLLLALSEHLNFALAYLISSTGTIALITGYAFSIFPKKKFAIISLIVLVLLYSFLYTILQMSDFALLLGNIGLFVTIGLIMFFSRKIEWYNEKVT